MARVLGRIRLSRLTDESTSLARQRELITDWAKNNGHEVVAWAEDSDVSGSVSPFDAPELGQYLSEDGREGWDILVAWKLDRLARNSINLSKLFIWIQENDKQLVCVSEHIDLSDWSGQMLANIIAGLAQGELEAITERAIAGKKQLRKTGRFQGGVAPYGYRAVDKPGGGKELIKDPEQQKILQWIYEQALKNRPIAHIVADLTDAGVPTTRQQAGRGTVGWHPSTINTLLTSKVYLGWTMHDGKPVLDDHGEPIMRCEPSISVEDYNRIAELRASRRTRVATKAKISPLSGVIVCWECGEHMHYNRYKGVESTFKYICRRHDRNIYVSALEAHAALEEMFLDDVAELPILEKRISTIGTTEESLEQARAAYAEITEFLPTAPDKATRASLFEQLTNLGKKIKDLESAVHAQDGVQWVDTGETYGERWEQLDTEGRRLLLTSAGIKFRARQIKPGNRWHRPIQEHEIILPPELQLLPKTKPVDLSTAHKREQGEFMAGLSEEQRQQIESARE